MKLSQFKFDLPLNLIAQHPAKKREDARMMVVHRKTGQIENRSFKDILEYFDDKDAVSGLAVASGIGTSVMAATLSGNIRIDNLTIIPEFRLDNSKEAIFAKNPNEGVKSTGTFLLAATWHF